MERITKKKKDMVEFMASAGQSNTGISRGENCDSAKLSYFGCEPVRKGPEIFDNMVAYVINPRPAQTTRFASSFISPNTTLSPPCV